MRWSGLTTDAAATPATPPLPLALPDAVVRTFDTPDFAGMTFYEVRAKSIINRVRTGSHVPFEWTINPYRGCSHACVYCLSGDTPVLMADGRTRPLAELRVGDQIIGTVRRGHQRRLVTTEVLAHWATVKPAYRVTLADGTRLTAGGAHRFLTPQGWKHVSGDCPGDGHPTLRPGDALVGPGQSPVPPKPTDDHPNGYRGSSGLAGTVLPPEAAVEVTSITPLGSSLPLYDLTTGTGDFIAGGVISHNCFARHTHTYLALDAGEDFDRQVIVKVNAGELLRRELAAPKWSGHTIAMGTNVDCYQRAEGRYRLMPDIIAALRDFANPFSILTKGTLLLRDLDLLRQAAEVTDVRLAFSVGFVDQRLWRSVEPGTPHPQRRLDAVATLSDAGFRVGVLMAPILPGLTDDDATIEATVAAIAAAGGASVTPLVLHLRPGARQWYGQWLAREHPHLVPRYRELFGRGSYADRDYQREVIARVRVAARRHGLGGDEPGHRRPGRDAGEPGRHRPAAPSPRAGQRRPPADPAQPTLW